MQTSWEKREGMRTDYICVNYNEVVVGHHFQTGLTDIAGACTHKEFLSGRFHDLIIGAFGEEVLKDVIRAVDGSHINPQHISQRIEVNQLWEFIEKIPADPELKNIINAPLTIDGFKNYGNMGGYKTRLESDSTVITYSRMKGAVECKKTGRIKNFRFAGYLSSCVELDDHYYLIGNDNFHVLSPEGEWKFTTEGILPGFGYKVRFHNVFRKDRLIAFSYRWLNGDYPDGLIRYEMNRGLTGRIELA